ncbi:MAG: hypothetical protein WCJ37_06445 [Syntrophus sp. (in: bacteria)]
MKNDEDKIFLPPVYEQELRGIYNRLDDARDMVVSAGGELPGKKATRADLTVFDSLFDTSGDFWLLQNNFCRKFIRRKESYNMTRSISQSGEGY